MESDNQLLFGPPYRAIPAKVLSVERDSCTVALLQDGIEMQNVGFYSGESNPDQSLMLAPKVNSLVLVGTRDGEHDPATVRIRQIDQVETIVFVIGIYTLEMTASEVFLSAKSGRIALTEDILLTFFSALL